MKSFIGVNGSPPETRHRLPGNFIDASQKRPLGFGDFKQAKKKLHHFLPENSTCKLSLKLFLVIVFTGTFLMLLRSPVDYQNEHFIHHFSRKDHRYASNLDVEWVQILKAVETIDARTGHMKIGLLNFNTSEMNHWQQLLPHAGFSLVHLNPVHSNVTWDVLYPEWIDEEEEYEVPVCPHLPEPRVSGGFHFDLIAVKLPCNISSGQWTRDVARLHLQLAAAKVAIKSARRHYPVHVLIVTSCFPLPNLFTCKNLVKREGNAWLYKPDMELLKEKLQLPVGSCELALPLKARERKYSNTPSREAYATILHSANVYVCGAIAAAQSIRLAGSKRDLVILVDEAVSQHHRSGLAAAGWKIKTIERIRNPKAERDAYNEWNYSKFRLWQLTEYDKIIFIDADLLILRNIDFLFTMPEITATGNNATLFNSGVMVVEPSNLMRSLLGGIAFRST